MNLKLMAEEILPYLEEKPVNTYEICAMKEMSFASIYQKLKILEAAGYVKAIKSGGNKTLWQINPEKPTTT